MDKAARIFYHFGWIVGIGWLVIAAGQIFIGLHGQATTNFNGWGTYTWLNVAMFVLGVMWLFYGTSSATTREVAFNRRSELLNIDSILSAVADSNKTG